MQAWMGWTAASAPGVKTALTWNEWCGYQQRILGGEKHQQARQQESIPFSDRELARLSFVRWLYQTGRLDPAQNKNA
jgi:hypothetical protein